MAGIYLHIPFCRQACNYCDFYFTTKQNKKDEFVHALSLELDLKKNRLDGHEPIETYYFGGGTPSQLSDKHIDDILNILYKWYPIISGGEITLEVNPDDLSPERIRRWKAAGINRLSLGIQSLDEAQLHWMHRAHTAGQALSAVAMCQDAGITNLTLDLIYGLPKTQLGAWEKQLLWLKDQQVPHFSAYALTLEPRTRLSKEIANGIQTPLEDSEMINCFTILESFIHSTNYEAYEISNFSLPGFRAKHNSAYWSGKPYLGFGPSAHSFISPHRIHTLPDLNSYLTQLINFNQLPPHSIENLTEHDFINEYILTRLRTIEGINLKFLQEKYNYDLSKEFPSELQEWNTKGWIQYSEENISLTWKGRLQADGISSSLFKI